MANLGPECFCKGRGWVWVWILSARLAINSKPSGASRRNYFASFRSSVKIDFTIFVLIGTPNLMVVHSFSFKAGWDSQFYSQGISSGELGPLCLSVNLAMLLNVQALFSPLTQNSPIWVRVSLIIPSSEWNISGFWPQNSRSFSRLIHDQKHRKMCFSAWCDILPLKGWVLGVKSTYKA